MVIQEPNGNTWIWPTKASKTTQQIIANLTGTATIATTPWRASPNGMDSNAKNRFDFDPWLYRDSYGMCIWYCGSPHQSASVHQYPISTNAAAGVSTFGALMSKCCFSGSSSCFTTRSSRPAEGHRIYSMTIVSTTPSFLQGDVQTVCTNWKNMSSWLKRPFFAKTICYSHRTFVNSMLLFRGTHVGQQCLW